VQEYCVAAMRESLREAGEAADTDEVDEAETVTAG
jgi:hypothetical protein